MLKILLKEGYSSDFTATDYETITQAANETGVPAAWIAGMVKSESGGNCLARAFNNDHLKGNTKRFGENWEAIKNAGLNVGAHGDGLKTYSDHRRGRNSHFDRAFRIAPKSAIRSAAWGTYQVMGWELLRLSGGDPYLAKKMFFDDPCGMSFKLFVSWIKTKKRRKDGPAFMRAANLAIETRDRKYFSYTVKKYLGKPKASYINTVMKYSKKFQEQFQGSAMASAPQVEGNVYLLGDSNTLPHSKYWKAYVAKNFGMNAKIINRAKNGYSLQKILNSLKDIKDTVGVVIGSAGGNNVAGMGKLSPDKIKSTLAPDGSYYQRNIAPLMSKLSELQRQGVKVAFFGLPFGRGKGKDCENNTPLARGTMDESLTYAAKQYNVPYYSVYKQTEKIKGVDCGVHYNGKKNQQAYRDALRSANPANAPAAKEELAYAKSISSGGKKVKISHNRFLRPYRYLRTAGVTFREFYSELANAFGSGWEKKLLPVHGADNIFGPEHLVAITKLAEKTQNSRLMAIINKKDPSKEEPIIAKAEDAALKKADKTIPVDNSLSESVSNQKRKRKIRIILKS
jgi:hypothetical protein